jgi:hypothetical protein
MNNIVLVVVIMIIFILVLKNHHQKEMFGVMNRRFKGYEELKSGSAPPWATEPKNVTEADKISKMIIKKINHETDLDYRMGVFDNIHSEETVNGKRYVCDLFTHEMKNKFTRRLIFDFTVLKNNEVQINKVNLSNAFRYPDKVYDDFGISNIILMDSNYDDTNHIMGTDITNIPYSKFEFKDGKENPTPATFQEWILPVGIEDNQEANFPCLEPKKFWDEDGIPITDEESYQCYGIKNTSDKYPAQPYDNPTINKQRTDNTDYQWLFDYNRNQVGHPHGISSGGS